MRLCHRVRRRSGEAVSKGRATGWKAGWSASGASFRLGLSWALADRIAPQVLASRLRGYQAADWHELITKDAVSARFARYKQHALVSELLDVGSVERVIDRWPNGGWDNREVMALYRNDLLGVLSLADFISANFEDN